VPFIKEHSAPNSLRCDGPSRASQAGRSRPALDSRLATAGRTGKSLRSYSHSMSARSHRVRIASRTGSSGCETLTINRKGLKGGSRAGAVPLRIDLSVAPRFLQECLTSLSVSPFPVPARSNAACRFPALRFPIGFVSKFMWLIALGALSALMLVVESGSH
jgi:hypothetical protein